MAYETAEQKRDRIHDEAANDAFGDVKPAPVKLPAAPAKPNEAVAVAKDFARGAAGASKAFGKAVRGPAEASAATVEGVKRAGAGVAGGDLHETAQGLRDTVMGIVGMPMAALAVPMSTLKGYIEGVRPGALDGEFLSNGGVVRDFTQGRPDPKNVEAVKAHNGPMSLGEALDLVGIAATGAAAHGAAGAKGEPKAGKPGAAPEAPKGTPQAARSAAEAKMAAAQAAPAAEVKPAVPAVKLTKEQQAKADIKAKFDAEATALKEKRAAQQSAAKPAEAPAVEPAAPGAAPTEQKGMPTPAEALGHEPIPEAVNPDTAELQASLGQDHAILSAERPGFTPEENAARTAALKADIEAMGINPTPAQGVYGGVAENSFFAQGMSLEQATELGKKYEQESVIHNGDLTYTTGENAGKVRANLGTTFDVPEGQDGTKIGNARFSNTYDWESDPMAREGAKPVEGTPAAEVPPAAEAAVEPAVEPQAQAEMGVPASDAVSATPQVQSIKDLHDVIEPAVATYGPPNEAAVKATKEGAAVLAQQLRASGMKESEIRDAVRAKLNEGGLLSKRQISEAVKAQEPITATGKVIPEESISAQLKRIRIRMHEITEKLLGDETGAVGVRDKTGYLKGVSDAIKKNSELWGDLQSVGSAILYKGARTLKAFSAEMLREFGDAITPHLQELYEGAQKTLKQILGEAKWGLPSTKKLMQLYHEGQFGQEWYDKSQVELERIFGANAGLYADVLAATSPNASVASNIAKANKFMAMILSGERTAEGRRFGKEDMPAVTANLNRILDGQELAGPKVGEFAKAIKGDQNAVVIDTWMKRAFGFEDVSDAEFKADLKESSPKLRFMKKMINDIATESGATPRQVQAAIWVAKKTRDEGADTASRGARPLHELVRESLKNTPLEELLAKDEGVGRALSAQMMEPDWITSDDPIGELEKTATGSGVSPEDAPGLVQKVVQAVKDRLNSTDPEGAQFNNAAMGFNPLDFWRLFHKSPDLTHVPYDRAGAEAAVKTQLQVLPGAAEALKLDLRKAVSEADAVKVRGAADSALEGVRGIMARVEMGARVEPGELQHAVTVAGVLAERARNAEIRAEGTYGRSGPDIVRPVNGDTLHAFGESIHNSLSEPELYGRLTSLDPLQQANWLANMYRASTVPSLRTGLGLWKMYMSLFFNEALSNPMTFAKNAVNSTASLPYTLATEGIAAQIGRFTKAETKVVPGQMGQLWAGYWSAIQDQWHGIASGDLQGLKLTMEQEGELHLTRPNPETMLDNIVNVTSVPSLALGVVNSPIKTTLRRGALFAETFRSVTQAAKSDPTLVGDKFWLEVERLRREPTKEIMQYANEFADVWSFTKQYDGIRGVISSNALAGDMGRIFIDPFARMGVNALSRAVEAHPFTALISPDFWADVTTPGGPQNRAMAKLVLGSAVLVTAMGMGQMGWCTGDGPPDPHANAMWRQAGNVPNTCVNPATGKQTLDHRALGFYSGFFASGADMALVWDTMSPDNRGAAVFGMAYAISEQLTHAGVIDTWSHIAKAVSNGLDGQELWAIIKDKLEAASLVMPNKIGVVRSITDAMSEGKPLVTNGRSTDIVDLTRKLILQDAGAGLPGWEEGQPQVRNQFTGKIILRPGLFKDTISADAPEAKVAAEIFRLQSAQRGLKFDIAQPKRSIGGSVPVAAGSKAESAYSAIPLEPWEFDRKVQLQTESKIGSKTLVETLTARIESTEYKRHAAAEKDSSTARAEGWCAARLREIYQNFETLGEDKLLKEDKHLQWLVNKSKAEAQNLQRMNPHAIPPEPPLTSYPRPGQNPR